MLEGGVEKRTLSERGFNLVFLPRSPLPQNHRFWGSSSIRLCGHLWQFLAQLTSLC